MDGAVYEWNVTSYKREGESVLKSCSYTSVAVSPDSRTTFAVGSDRTLKEICDSQVKRPIQKWPIVKAEISPAREFSKTDSRT